MNSSSQLFTLSDNTELAKKRLIFFTGKGGVGKTLLSLAYTNSLYKKGFKVRHVSFKDVPPAALIQKLKIPHQDLNLEDSTLIYLELKLKSKRIAKWISQSSFFQAIFHMLPSLEDMVLLGHLIYELNEDPELIYIVDTPSSGHAFSLFESLDLWKNIFISGALIDDINMMKNFLQDKEKTIVYIASIMSELSLQESRELKEFTDNLNLESKIILNDVYSRSEALLKTKEPLPQFLNHKVDFEKKTLEGNNTSFVPHFFNSNSEEIVSSISKEVLEK